MFVGVPGDPDNKEDPQVCSLARLAKLVSASFTERPRLKEKGQGGHLMLTSDLHLQAHPFHTHAKKSEPPGPGNEGGV